MFDDGGATFENLHIENCTFTNCALSLTKKVSDRSIIRNAEIVNCRANGCDIGPAVLEKINISNFETNDLLIIWGALFNQVKISGRIGHIKINRYAHHLDRSIQASFDLHKENFYSNVDWALDITEARFKGFDFQGIPGSLIKRDPESQVLITRERAMQHDWKDKLSPTYNVWRLAINSFLTTDDPDIVLVAPLDAPKKKRDSLIQGLHELRSLGVAIPD